MQSARIIVALILSFLIFIILPSLWFVIFQNVSGKRNFAMAAPPHKSNTNNSSKPIVDVKKLLSVKIESVC